MKTMSVKDANYGFGWLIDLARAAPVLVATDGWPVEVVKTDEEYERLKVVKMGQFDRRLMDQAICKKDRLLHAWHGKKILACARISR